MAALVALVVVFILTCGFQSRPPLALNGNLTFETNKDVRIAFEELAKSAGLSVVFPGYSPPGTGTVFFRAQNLSIPDALDLLSRQTKTFWSMWDDHTIIVAEDTEQNRRLYDRLFVAIIEIPDRQDPNPILAKLPGIIAVDNKLVMKGSLSGIEKARQTVAELLGRDSRVEATLLDSTFEVFLGSVGSGLRSATSKRNQLRMTSPTISLDESAAVREIYLKLAATTGLNVMFGRNFPHRTTSFRAQALDFFDALDKLSLQTGMLWQPINENTIQVLDDTQQNRRDFESHHLETIHLPDGTTRERLNAIANAARSVLNLRGIYLYEPRHAIVLKDTPENLAIVDNLVSQLEGTPTLNKTVLTDLTSAFSETGSTFHSAAATRASLKLKIAGTLPFNQDADLRTVYESLAQAAGLAVVFGAKFPSRSMNFDLKGVDAIEALDLLARQSGTFWQPLDEHTILVFDDTQQNHRDYEVRIIKTILLPTRTTDGELNGLMNLLRTLLSLRGIYQSTIAKAIVVQDTPARVELVEKVIRELIPNPNAIVSLTVPAPGFAETNSFNNAAFARTKLDFSQTGPISKVLNQDAGIAYQSLAEMGGIKINFDPQFNGGAPMPLRLEGSDIPDALDRLSLQTGNYWTVLDPKTILVAPNTLQIHRQFDPQMSRTIGVKTLTAGFVADVVNILRTALSMRSVMADGAYSITIVDTPQRIAIAEQIVANLDRP